MRPIIILLGLLACLLALCVLIFTIPEPINGHSMAHHSCGRHAPGRRCLATESNPYSAVGYLLGALIYLIISTLVYIGVTRAKRDGKFTLAHSAATLVVLGMWSLLMYLFRQYLHSGDPMIDFAFPLPTLVMLLGLWIAPMSFSLIYILGYRRWIFTPEDEQTFRELMERKRS